MRDCPNCESRIPFDTAWRAVRRRHRIQCPACRYSVQLAGLTKFWRLAIGAVIFAVAIAVVELTSFWLSWKPMWLMTCAFFVVFIGLLHLGWAGLAIVAAFSDPLSPVHCVRCRYDLRGTSSSVCPECGRAFECMELESVDATTD